MGSKKIMKKIKDAILRGSRSPSPEPGPSTRKIENVIEPVSSSFSEFLDNELTEDYHKLVATSFAMLIRDDSEAKLIKLDDVFYFLSDKQKKRSNYSRRFIHIQNLFQLMKRLFPDRKKNRVGHEKLSYVIAFDQFEELLLAAQTPEGSIARKAIFEIKKAVFKFIKLEKAEAQQILEEQTAKLALTEQEKTTLATQLKNLREANSYLYAFWLFDDRDKCGITDNPNKRERQHQTSPSGRMIHTVMIARKQSNKLLDSIMKSHGNHVRQEEYEISYPVQLL